MKGLLRLIAAVIVAWALLGLVWQWGFCRFYVGPDRMAVVTAKSGKPLPEGQILAQPGERGIQEQVLAEGRHFLNPYLYDHEIRPVLIIPAGKIGVVTSKVGKDLPPGEFLAGPGEKGIQRRVLGPGKYRLNPYAFEVEVVDAMTIPIGYAGVVTSLSGTQTAEDAFAGPGEKGVREDILHPGLYYVNPKEYQVGILEIGVNQVSLLGRDKGQVITKGPLETQNRAMEALQSKVLLEQADRRRDYVYKRQLSSEASMSQAEKPVAMGKAFAPPREEKARDRKADKGNIAQLDLSEYVEFPSRDGFTISLDMTVEFELLPRNIASIYRRYGDLPAVVDKIILPQILSVSRNKGSVYRAKDFIQGEGREKFQKDITDALGSTLGEKDIIAHNALIRHVEVPMQILDPIQKASVAQEQDLTNKERQNTARKMAELNTEQTLIEQRRQEVAQQTEKMRAEIQADQEKQVATIAAEGTRLVAEIEKNTAAVRAERARKLGKADSESVRLVEGERVSGIDLKSKAFGDPNAYSLWELANTLSPSLKISLIHTGPGTLWTDLENARLGDLGGAATIKTR